MPVGGKTDDVEDCGACMLALELADTVASSSLSKMSTQPESTGKMALCAQVLVYVYSVHQFLNERTYICSTRLRRIAKSRKRPEAK